MLCPLLQVSKILPENRTSRAEQKYQGFTFLPSLTPCGTSETPFLKRPSGGMIRGRVA